MRNYRSQEMHFHILDYEKVIKMTYVNCRFVSMHLEVTTFQHRSFSHSSPPRPSLSAAIGRRCPFNDRPGHRVPGTVLWRVTFSRTRCCPVTRWTAPAGASSCTTSHPRLKRMCSGSCSDPSAPSNRSRSYATFRQTSARASGSWRWPITRRRWWPYRAWTGTPWATACSRSASRRIRARRRRTSNKRQRRRWLRLRPRRRTRQR